MKNRKYGWNAHMLKLREGKRLLRCSCNAQWATRSLLCNGHTESKSKRLPHQGWNAKMLKLLRKIQRERVGWHWAVVLLNREVKGDFDWCYPEFQVEEECFSKGTKVGMRCSCAGHTESKSMKDSLPKDEIKEWMKHECNGMPGLDCLMWECKAENAGKNSSQSWVKVINLCINSSENSTHLCVQGRALS